MTAFVLAETLQWVLLIILLGLVLRIIMWMGIVDPESTEKRLRDLEERNHGDGK